MSPDADTGKLIWEMSAFTVTLITVLLFAYEFVRGRGLANAKKDADKRWSEIHALILAESQFQKPTTAAGKPWTPRNANKAY